MRLSEPPPSPLDIVFWLFRTRVRINPGFWIMCLFLGWHYFEPTGLGSIRFPMWVLAVGVSILLHEFGHIFAGWAFRQQGEVLLHSMGGLAIYKGDALERWQSIIISLAGPAIQLVLFLALYLQFGWPLQTNAGRFAWVFFLDLMLYINLYWALLNLLPIWPLDGGQVFRHLCLYITKYGTTVSLWVSLLLAGALTFNALVPRLKLPDPAQHVPSEALGDVLHWLRGDYMAIFWGLFAVTALTELWGDGSREQERERDRERERRRRHFDDPDW